MGCHGPFEFVLQLPRELCIWKTAPAMPQGIEQYLEIDSGGVKELRLLERYSRIHVQYSLGDIEVFYSLHCFTDVQFPLEICKVAEILYNCRDFMNSVPDDLLARIARDWFIIRNGLLEALSQSGVGTGEFLRGLERRQDAVHPYLIECTGRVVELVNCGRLYPFMTNCCPSQIRLCKPTFRYLLYHVDVESIMAYTELTVEEVALLVERMARDRPFSRRCRKFIETQGVLNDTMLLIASICNLNPVIRGTVSPDIHSYYCGKHFSSVYIPLSAFSQVLELSQLEVYFIYLYHRTDISDNLQDILETLKTTPTGLSGMAVSCPLDSGSQFCPGVRSIQSHILGLVLARGHTPRYDADVFKYLPELKDEPYFRETCRRYARGLLEDNIFDQVPDDLLKARAIIEYLSLCGSRWRIHKTEEDDMVCSLETIQTSLLMSSTSVVEVCLSTVSSVPEPHPTATTGISELHLSTVTGISEPHPTATIHTLELHPSTTTNIPLICFKEHGWLSDHENSVLLDHYVELFSVNELAGNLLQTSNVSSKVILYFEENIEKITDRTLKAAVCCRLNIPFDPFDLTESEVRAVIDMPGSAFQLRHYMYVKKIAKPYIQKFVEKLTLQQLDVMIHELPSMTPTTDFILAFISTITGRYDLMYISEVLARLMGLRSVEIVRRIQKYILDLLGSMFIDADYLAPIERLYALMLGFGDREIRSNNDKILALIGKASAAMDKGVYIGNLKGAVDSD